MLPEFLVAASGALFAYHHFAYPLVLRRLAKGIGENPRHAAVKTTAHRPELAVIVPAHDEAAHIEAKVANLAALAYPDGLLQVIIVVDGSSDATAELARRSIAASGVPDRFHLVVHHENRGKVAVLNEALSRCDAEIVVLTDASARMEADALERIADHFADPRVGVVCARYRLSAAGSEGERAYWNYQVRIKQDEASVGAPMGAHGACYAMRRDLAETLEPDTINDDFILPMRIVARGYHSVYDASIVVTEAEVTRRSQEWRRRVRIGAGNLQQALRLWRLADPRRLGTAFVFLSGKALRAFMPFIVLLGFGALAHLAFGGSTMHQWLLVFAVALLSVATFAAISRTARLPRPLGWLGYLLQGHTAGLVGATRYAAGLERRPWRRAANASPMQTMNYIPRSVEVSKRMMDIACGLVALAVLAVLFIPIALAIKLTSRGPIFYRQLRVGRQTEQQTHLFWLVKFRTMYVDAEQRSGAVWAAKNDPRITPVGRFMRKTRLDELPQCFNVLRGEMSVIGPRPERPVFFTKLESEIPFYTERTFGLKPGITGLAQVNQDYDASIEDVRNKVLYDHAYSARITSWVEWMRTDIGILLSTARVVALGKGQ
jgi:lipopolysaccharide/colanic/teichoic acid biosynthesis glycosyltransferase/glycosyltransferase involved in cell wall biosynthesis